MEVRRLELSLLFLWEGVANLAAFVPAPVLLLSAGWAAVILALLAADLFLLNAPSCSVLTKLRMLLDALSVS
jgi:hypothetical protein